MTSPSPVPNSAVSINGSTASVGGDVVGGDKVTQNYYQLDIQKLLESLRQVLPENDPTPQHLLDTLKQFQTFHEHLYEWKELHNCVNDVIYTVDQFAREVERMDASGQAAKPRDLARQWRPVAQKVDLLLTWAASIKHIAPVPFVRDDNGDMRGPSWAVELQAGRLRIDELFNPQGFDPNALYDASCTFVDTAERNMYLADKKLRETASELYNLSRIILGGLVHD